MREFFLPECSVSRRKGTGKSYQEKHPHGPTFTRAARPNPVSHLVQVLAGEAPGRPPSWTPATSQSRQMWLGSRQQLFYPPAFTCPYSRHFRTPSSTEGVPGLGRSAHLGAPV